jgi:hypothetical protein
MLPARIDLAGGLPVQCGDRGSGGTTNARGRTENQPGRDRMLGCRLVRRLRGRTSLSVPTALTEAFLPPPSHPVQYSISVLRLDHALERFDSLGCKNINAVSDENSCESWTPPDLLRRGSYRVRSSEEGMSPQAKKNSPATSCAGVNPLGGAQYVAKKLAAFSGL